ncbi:MAG: hypothetical protein K9W46_06215 [Candidatus Heimdallarchaeum endolithica]|uniref:Uncharacterized protein n=1 Tax=Candidatus Heimdallarchaeum endolithica TaxID=2876572 RepID=A0A9Y1FR90_9ARCH|nr:MAG: hypothetical protein K9W46_06215 [Candidatus Heimdallarchaeum endolithica]
MMEEDYDVLLLTLFEIEKKYKKLLRKKIPLLIDESEKDREQTSDIYQYLLQNKEKLLDAEVYEDYILMYKLREELNLENILKNKSRINSFSNFVRKKSTPLVSVVGKKTFPSSLLHFEKSEDSIINPQINDEYGFWDIRGQQKLESEILTFGDFMSLERKLEEKLLNKELKKSELEKLLSSIELEVLSKMTSEKTLIAVSDGDKIRFCRPSSEEDAELSSSLLLTSKKKEDE